MISQLFCNILQGVSVGNIGPIFLFKVFMPLNGQVVVFHPQCLFITALGVLGPLHRTKYIANFFPAIFTGNKTPQGLSSLVRHKII